MIATIREAFNRRDCRQVDRHYVGLLRSNLLSILRQEDIRPLPDLANDFATNSEGFRDIEFLLTTFFGAELVILREEQALG